MTKYQTLNEFPQCKYTTWYKTLIDNALVRTSRNPEEYYERHHIIPKFLGGSNYKSNLVDLTIKEHYISHLILVQICKHISKRALYQAVYSVFAFHMNYLGTELKTVFLSSSRIIPNRKLIGKHLRGKKAHNKGQSHSDQTKRKMSDNHWLKRTPHLHPMLGKHHSKKSTLLMSERKTKVRYKAISPNGVEFDNVSIESFVRIHNLNRDAIRKYQYGSPIPCLYPGRENLAQQSRLNTTGWTFFRY
jgi:hypothetical protein